MSLRSQASEGAKLASDNEWTKQKPSFRTQNMTPLERITERVTRHGDVNEPATPRPLLTLAEFFEGNEAIGSIGCNLTPMPELSEFYEMLRRIATRPEVADVRVQVTMFDDPD